ncbi:MAG: glycosyltransferase [Gemmatimonadaceae bacterium]|nr:glycosyltransferase [Gemmatimonadaceae bacterium]
MPTAKTLTAGCEFSISIVSHGHGPHVGALLHDFSRLLESPNAGRCEFLITLNIPEDEGFLAAGKSLRVHLHRNSERLGFGANHNAAFERSRGRHFVVVNPDIRLRSFRLDDFADALTDASVGAVAPRVVDSAGMLQDSVRRFPTIKRLAWRYLSRDWRSEYAPTKSNQVVDWAAGMFLVVRNEAWRQVRGFDERFFMYFEDVDLCRRLGTHGWRVLYVPSLEVVHDARRATHRDPVHLRWHVRSALRYFSGF